MAQAVNRRTLPMEVQAQSQVAHLGFMVEKLALLYFVLQVLWFPCQYTSAMIHNISFHLPSTYYQQLTASLNKMHNIIT
jgi:hypothetical protein